MEKLRAHEGRESPQYVRTSLAAAMTMGIAPGKFFRDAKLYCINLLLTYDGGCAGKCAYCGLSRVRETSKTWGENSFIRVDWPTVALDEVISRMSDDVCSHVERVCVSMITNGRARKDTIEVVDKLHKKFDSISALLTPTIIDKGWMTELKMAGADMVGIAIDAATPELFEKFRGSGVKGPHTWKKYWSTVEEAVEVFGRNMVGIHLIVGLGETEKEMVTLIQRAQNMGVKTHLFSFYPEEGSPLQDLPQPPIGEYRRIQLARYLINHDITTVKDLKFDENGQIKVFGATQEFLDDVIESGLPFLTSGCGGKTLENACNRPFANCNPFQAYSGKFRNFPFQTNEEDIRNIRKQI
ncbi:MAG: radical SAM protein [Candidatus Bathyarchaeia archaeon]